MIQEMFMLHLAPRYDPYLKTLNACVVFNRSPLQYTMSSAFSEGRITNPLKGHFQAKEARDCQFT